MLKDANRALTTTITIVITPTNELVYATAALIREMLGYTIKKNSSIYMPWKIRLEVKIQGTQREVSQLVECRSV